MRSGDPGFEVSRLGTDGSWRINIEPGHAWKSRGAWGTPFSAFRFAVPELMEFHGRAIYLDSDMLVRGDIRELVDADLHGAFRCATMQRTDVAVIDCGWFKDRASWPSIAQMKPSGWLTYHYCEWLRRRNAIFPTLDAAWNACDQLDAGKDPGLGDAKLLHFTTVPTQPYEPYPTVKYRPHPWASWVDAWRAELMEARVPTP